ncbi:MAG: glycosyltransferase family 2 protein [Calditrichaceae bacterium]|nr:glycosyltransferase family 2 protein [Calditrichaceae bacterium]
MPGTKVSVILHHDKDNDVNFANTLKSIYSQTLSDIEVLIISDPDIESSEKLISDINKNHIPTRIITESNDTLGGYLNSVFYSITSDYILYIHNPAATVLLKQSALDLLLLACQRNADTGMVYADYELQENDRIKDIHLLKHHIGRVRDNQDYGCVFLFCRDALETCGWADEDLKFKTLYDLRLKLAEKYKLIHVANRYAGSLYRIMSEGLAHNVFDYLLAGRESQVEAEKVLTEHLKRINAYLKPGSNYHPRPEIETENELIASVIIPVNNRPEFIGTAIESVQTQTVQQIEVIVVVNGGPDDPTANEVRRYMPGGDKYDASKPAVQLLVHDINNLGLCLNMGAQAAKGTYYVQLDSDDRLKPDAVEKILKVYNSDPKIGMVIGSYEVWRKDDAGNYSRMEELPVVTHDEWTEENGRNNLLRINGAGAPRSLPIALIRQIGFSVNDEPYARNYGEDYNMVLEVSERYRIGRVWDAIYEVVRHAGGTDHSIDQQTIDRNDEAKDYVRLQAIQRRIKLNIK